MRLKLLRAPSCCRSATLAAKQAANAGTEARLRELNQRKGELDKRAASLT
jgi:exonuclease SbcC